MADSTAHAVQEKHEKQDKKKKGKSEGGLTELNPPPAFIEERDQIFNKLYAEYLEEVAKKPRAPIKITLPDGKVVEGTSWETTPYAVASDISKQMADRMVISEVNGDLWDLDRPLEGDCSLVLHDFESNKGKEVFWHSTAHILGESLERVYGGCLCYGPPLVEEGGFYYDMYLEGKGVGTDDYPAIETVMKKVGKENQKFERLEMKKEDLLEMFKYNQFKVRILNEKVTTPTTTVYRCGTLIDLCRGPHVRHTGKVKAMAVTKSSSAYWEGNDKAESLQRVYGISFPDAKQLKEWIQFQEEAAKRDHRKIGRDQELFFFHELSPGSCFFLPHGTRIYNTLMNLIKGQYHKRGFSEVMTPNMFDIKLWKTSGHWQHYQEDMFAVVDPKNDKCCCGSGAQADEGVDEGVAKGEKPERYQFALKPMNCPGHCLMFKSRVRSWRELPLRLADFGVLHRNEISGALHGLTRVRRFQQDDAHIFCRQDQIEEEINGALDFVKHVYGILGFTFTLKLSTRPEKYMGDINVWNRAEEQLQRCLEASGISWTLNPGDGAFYGPKIDITIRDALGRPHQCATIQLDFQLPLNFDLSFKGKVDTAEPERPVMIHRAVLGSVERMIAVVTESFGGKWPFWLSPRQALIVPVAPTYYEYAEEVRQFVHDAGFYVEVDTSADTLNKKIRNGQLAQYNYILVVGEKEMANKSVNVRSRENQQLGEVSVADLVTKFQKVRDTYSPVNEL